MLEHVFPKHPRTVSEKDIENECETQNESGINIAQLRREEIDKYYGKDHDAVLNMFKSFAQFPALDNIME